VWRTGEGGRWRLVGERYVHGLMYAQPSEMLDLGEMEERQWIFEYEGASLDSQVIRFPRCLRL